GFAGLSLDDDALNNLGAPKLALSGNGILVRPGATVRASQMTLSGGSGAIDVGEGATLTTIGMPALTAADSTPQTYSSTTLLLSNNVVGITGSTGTGAITIESGASLLAGGTLAFASNGASSIAPDAVFGARDIALAVNTVNIGDDAADGAVGLR